MALGLLAAATRPHPRPLPKGEGARSPLSRLRERVGVRVLAVLLAASLLTFSLCGLRAILFSSTALAPQLEGRDISVVGVVAAMPQRNETGVRFRLDIESATSGGAPVSVPPRIHLGWYGGAMPDAAGAMELLRQAPELHAGERWQMTVRLKAPHGNSNPHGFDYELWLWEQGVQATGYVRSGPRDRPPQRIGVTWAHPVERARQSVRDAIFAHVADRKTAGLLAALVVGDQNAIDRADWDVFRATGVAHLMSISGLHITMFAWAAALLTGALWRRSSRLCLAWPAQSAALVGGVLLATGYALFSGWGVPAQRTVWMLATVGLLRLSGRRWPWPQVWLLACAVVVTLDPWALLQAGFWLSFVAVGVLFATDAGEPSESKTGRWAQAASRLLAALREQWVITLALAPLTLLLFGQVSVVGLLANALAIPWVTLVITPLALAGVAVPALWDAAAWAVQGLTVYLSALAALPFATVSAPAPALWAGAVGVVGGVLLAMRLPWHMRLLGVPLLLPVLLWQVARPAPGHFELLAADIGQGNAVVVRTATHTLVYDAGPRYSAESDAGHRVLVPLLRAFDEKVDTVVLSHRDSDHTGGAAAVLAMQPQATLLSSIEEGHELQALRKSQRCAAGQRWRWDGVEFEVLHPAAADYGAGVKSNAMSCVLRISNGTQTALLAGDIEQAQEARLVAQSTEPAGMSLKTDVLLVPHHGSKTSSTDVFLNAATPSMAIVQAGYRNRFGHPAAPVLERYRLLGVRVIDSPHCGAAHWRSDQPARIDCQRETAPRYWHHRFP
ncbi:DNA internalization-related competence protein ComEC/Rec2 [Ramlibacter sp. WS9]|nr:DNA internalization-related competence protein ComEC/Rec2 [Ramlibacter sp. WS9]ROZ61419.1 DNA internalization-related competence protein ComEC/Rec2 [Ramlibacter sp. WS9]